jgi:general secretion pathway protein L
MSLLPLSESRSGAAVLALWQNWRAEWADDLQSRRARLGAKDDALVMLDFSADHHIVVLRGGLQLGRVAKTNHNAAQELALILDRAGVHGETDAMLCLPKAELLSRRIQLPFMSVSSLRGALQYELERLTPLPPDRLYFDFFTHLRERKTNRVEIDVRLIKREVVDRAIELARQVGAGIGVIRFENESRDADWRSFPVDRSALLRHIWRRLGLAICGGLATLLFLVLLLCVYARQDSINAAYAAQIDQERAALHSVELLQRQVRDAQIQLSFPVRQKKLTLLTQTLANLAQALPDNSWIEELDLTGDQLRLRGASRSASDLVAALDRSGTFAHAAFTAPIIRNPQDQLDHFDLSATVAGGTR